jgi:hypothetical protein
MYMVDFSSRKYKKKINEVIDVNNKKFVIVTHKSEQIYVENGTILLTQPISVRNNLKITLP